MNLPERLLPLHPTMEIFRVPGGLFDVEPCSLDLDVGRRVRFKDPKCETERNCVWEIVGVQRIYSGQAAYRVRHLPYETTVDVYVFDKRGRWLRNEPRFGIVEDSFGRPASPRDVVFVDDVEGGAT